MHICTTNAAIQHIVPLRMQVSKITESAFCFRVVLIVFKFKTASFQRQCELPVVLLHFNTFYATVDIDFAIKENALFRKAMT